MSAAETHVDPDLLPFTDPAFWHDPYPYYDRVRALTPVYASPAGVHVVTRHADVAALIRDPRMSALELSFGVGDRFHDSVLGQTRPTTRGCARCSRSGSAARAFVTGRPTRRPASTRH